MELSNDTKINDNYDDYEVVEEITSPRNFNTKTISKILKLYQALLERQSNDTY